MSLHARKQLTAWLGLAAMCLLVLAPLVSQWAVAALSRAEPQGVLCSAAPANAAHVASVGMSAHHHGVRLSACGYCSLLADHSVAPPPHLTAFVLFMLACSVSVAIPVTRYVPLGTFFLARPRAPPVHSFSHSFSHS